MLSRLYQTTRPNKLFSESWAAIKKKKISKYNFFTFWKGLSLKLFVCKSFFQKKICFMQWKSMNFVLGVSKLPDFCLLSAQNSIDQ